MKYTTDKNFFKENVQLEIKSYLLGFIAADGGIENNGIKSYMLRMVQKEQYPLLLLQQFISPKVPITKIHKGKINEAYRITICSKELCLNLIELGLNTRKTYKKMSIPKECNKKDYIRGYFDGDGTITYCTYNNKIQMTCRIVAYDKNILLEISKELTKNKIDNSIRQYGNYFYLNIFKSTIKTFYNYIYKNSNYYLKRKKIKFHEFYKLTSR